MNIATGSGGADQPEQGPQRGRRSEVLQQIDDAVPRGLAVHVVLDNLSAHSTPEIKKNKWLAHRDRCRWQILHFTPHRAHG